MGRPLPLQRAGEGIRLERAITQASCDCCALARRRGLCPDANQMSGGLSVTFWGVRGSIACAGPTYQRYGGNTSCLEVRCDGHVLIFDAGTGLRPLGEKLKAEGTRD